MAFVEISTYHVIFKSIVKKGNRAVTESLIYLHSQPPFACGVGSCQNGGSCVEDCDGNRKCMCTVGYTGAHCENILTTETLRKKHNKNLSFVLILSIVIIIYRQSLNLLVYRAALCNHA